MVEDQFLTVEQVSKTLQLHPYTVLKYIKEGKLRGVKLGRMYRLKKSDVEAFLEKNGLGKSKEEKEVFKMHREEKKVHGSGLESDHYIIE